MLKKIKSLFLEEDPNAAQMEPATPSNNETGVKTENTYVEPTVSPSFSETVPSGAVDKIDPKFIDILMKAIEQENRDGFDYLEFKNSLQSLSKLEMDEPTRYKSAFVMGKTMGLSKEMLLQSVQHYVSVINAEETKFKEALQKQKALQVQGKEESVKTAEAAIAQKQKQIQELEKQIEEQKASIEKTKNEMKEAVVKIDHTNAQFMAAHKMISQQMIQDIQNIKNFIE